MRSPGGCLRDKIRCRRGAIGLFLCSSAQYHRIIWAFCQCICQCIWTFVSSWAGTTGRWETNWRTGHLLCGRQVKMETRARAAGAGREGVGEGKNCSFFLGLKFQLGFSNHKDLLPFQLVGWSPVGVLWWPTFGSCPNACKLLVWQISAIASLFWCGSWMV